MVHAALRERVAQRHPNMFLTDELRE